jgi:hypothetical protein
VAGNGTLQELAARYKKIITTYDLEQWAPQDFDFKEFKKGLASLKAMAPCPGCLAGGGNPQCQMRECARSKHLSECSLCEEQASFPHREQLERMRTASLDAGLFVRTARGIKEEQIDRWTKQLENSLPSSILFWPEK